jgi:hypothetical protein
MATKESILKALSSLTERQLRDLVNRECHAHTLCTMPYLCPFFGIDCLERNK